MDRRALRWLIVGAAVLTLLNTAHWLVRRSSALPPAPGPMPASERFTLHYPPDGSETIFLVTLDAVVVTFVGLQMWLAARRRRFGPGAILASFAVAWAIFEIPLALYIRAHPAPFVPDSLLFWRFTPNLADVRMPNVRGDVSINAHGMRGPEVERAKPAGTFRVMVLGDSTLFGHGVTQDEMFSTRLRAELEKARPERRVEVLNAAVPGYTTYQGLEYLKSQGLGFDPDWLVIGFNNDAEIDFLTDRERAPRSSLGRAAMRAMYGSSVYLLLRKMLVNAGAAGDQERLAELERQPLRERQEKNRVPVAELRENLLEMVALCRQRGIGCTLLILPRNPAHGAPFSLGYREAMLDLKGTSGLSVVDVFPLWRAPEDAALFIEANDALHLNATGHERLARLVADSMRAGIPVAK